MPKQVDADQRRLEVVEAVFRIIERDGIQHTSLRAVAGEAQLNIGSVRHYFATHHELMRFAMQEMLQRIGERVLHRIDEHGDLSALTPAELAQHAVNLLAELLPLDESRRREVAVFIEFATAARTNPDLADLAHRTAVGTRTFSRRVLERLREHDALRTELDVDVETERLTTLLDGLSLNALLQPDLLPPEQSLSILRGHIAQLQDRQAAHAWQ